MPTRLFREGLIDSDRMASVDDECGMLFVRLMLLADDYGRFDGRPAFIQIRAYPTHTDPRDKEPGKQLRPSEGEIRRRLGLLEGAGLLRQYTVGGKPYIEILNFNQRHRARTSKYPDPPETLSEKVRVTAPLGETQEGSGPPPAAGDPKLIKRTQAKAAAIAIVDYLNSVANTQYKTVEGTLQWPMARILEGATEEELRAVVDLKVREVQAGTFDIKYLRPETLFNKTKFNSYVGQLSLGAAPTLEKRVRIRCWKDGEEPKDERDAPLRGSAKPDDVAREWLRGAWRYVQGVGYRNISVQIDDAPPAIFSIEELKRSP